MAKLGDGYVAVGADEMARLAREASQSESGSGRQLPTGGTFNYGAK